jgi:hypothetical protein
MQGILDRLGIPLSVAWIIGDAKSIHGEIKQVTLYINDQTKTDAFATFTHEIIEFKLKEVTRVYRVLINNLVDGYEKLAYQQKEEFIEFMLKLMEVKKNRGT